MAMHKFFKTSTVLAAGVVLGATGLWLLGPAPTERAADSRERQPLYWVAPMDPDYRRDRPGKSPMGMELIPVYEEPGAQAAPGAVRISPDVVNNLGVRTAQVEAGRLSADIKTVGYVQYDEDRLIHVHPRVEGWIETLYVKAVGDPIERGEPLYTLYSPTLVNAQEELLLALKRDNPVLIDAARARLASLQVPGAAIEQLRKTGQVSQTITLYAPQSGVVDNLEVREGMYVKPGMALMSIGVLDPIWVIGEVFERQASMVHVGNAVRMRLDYLPGRQWRGRVDYIYPSLNPTTRTAQVRVRFDNPDRYLRPGMFAQMEIDTEPGDAALLVPREALIRTGSQSRVVLALGEGRFKSVAVQVGRIAGQRAEILSGLQAGERIVTSAQFLIDSESSKSSDFRRMHHDDGAMDHAEYQTAQPDKTPKDHGEHRNGDRQEMPAEHAGHQMTDTSPGIRRENGQ
ncbi:MAG: efflux RND transporter periplasmic adaptor subunit [Halioglobus sp.]|nr:efflux RND transporter periplasmic adaptor subunit [Halioglobus sp.]